jgi:hypothetical protein
VFEDENHIMLAYSNGSARKIPADEFEKMLKPQETKLNIDAVFVNIPNGSKIAQVFKNL